MDSDAADVVGVGLERRDALQRVVVEHAHLPVRKWSSNCYSAKTFAVFD
jgi:hypothetical protein